MGEPVTMGQVVSEELGIGKAPEDHLTEIAEEANGVDPNVAADDIIKDATGIEAMKEEDKEKESVAGQYMVLVRNDSAQTWWGEIGPYHIKDGDPKKQALESSPELKAAADEDGVTLKAIPLSSWRNQKTYKYDRVLRELD